MTEFSSKVLILAELYAKYSEDKGFKEFIEYNDIGLPMSWMMHEGLCMPSEEGMRFISETFELFVASCGLKDTGFSNLDEMLNHIE